MHAISLEYMFYNKKIMSIMCFLAYICLFFNICLLGMEFIDSKGKSYQLTASQRAIFLASELGSQLKDDINQGNKVDFSLLKRPCLQGRKIIRVLHNTEDPTYLTLTSEVVPEEIHLLETANALGLQNQACARHLAQRLWPLIQESGPNPLKLTDWQKKGVKAIARPYAPCPALMLQYLQENRNSKKVKNRIFHLLDEHACRLNLSHTVCYDVGYHPKFGTLAGLEDLVRYLCRTIHVTSELDEVNLDDHMLDTFSLKDIQHMEYQEHRYPFRNGLRRLLIRKNCISELSEHQIDTTDLPTVLLDLSDNSISNVSDGVFKAINGSRARYRIQYHFHLSLARNLLNPIQKEELQKKFYKATHTIPERWTIDRTIVTYKYLLAIAPLIIVLYHDPQFFIEPASVQKSAAAFLTLFWWYYLFVNRFDMRLAQISHPTIGKVWGGDIHDRSGAIWPKNNAKLLL